MLTSMRQHGISLVETMVALVIMAFVLAMAAPNFSNWIAGTRIRATAEGLLSGLQVARNEATTRNTRVRFQLTTSLDGGCARSTADANWVVDVVDADPDQDSVEKKCDAAPSDSDAPSILQVRAAAEAGGNVRVAADASQIVFNGLGRQVPVDGAAAANTVNIDLTPLDASKCGKVTCLRIVITAAGQVRMCNPNIAAGDPQACT